MSVNSFFPTTETGQLVWLTHYSLKLLVNGPLCGISPEEIIQTQTDILYYLWLLQEWHPATQRDAKEATAYKQ
ncbi:MAG: hypothetical protein RIR39_1850, partial [Pseudomonadota bacterium]